MTSELQIPEIQMSETTKLPMNLYAILSLGGCSASLLLGFVFLYLAVFNSSSTLDVIFSFSLSLHRADMVMVLSYYGAGVTSFLACLLGLYAMYDNRTHQFSRISDILSAITVALSLNTLFLFLLSLIII
jgi:hypothetical protein